MNFYILTIFPQMFDALNHSIVKRAKENNLVTIKAIDIRDFSKDKHKKVDDMPYGGGAGMVMNADPIYKAYLSIVKDNPEDFHVIFLSPKGKTLTQKTCENYASLKNIILICGHYEGIDQRLIDTIVDEEVSIGDYVLTGGELPAMILIDSTSRLVEGVLNKESLVDESFTNELLEYPQYTRPNIWNDMSVPDVLLSGNHKEINNWRLNSAISITKKNRPDLYKKYMDNINKKEI